MIKLDAIEARYLTSTQKDKLWSQTYDRVYAEVNERIIKSCEDVEDQVLYTLSDKDHRIIGDLLVRSLKALGYRIDILDYPCAGVHIWIQWSPKKSIFKRFLGL